MKKYILLFLLLLLAKPVHAVDILANSVNLAAPGPIGATTPSTGQFTQVGVGTAPTQVNEIFFGNTSSGSPPSGAFIGMDTGAGGELNIGNSTTSLINISFPGVGSVASFDNASGRRANFTGHISSSGGTAPTLTAGCNGAGSSVLAGSNNNRGQFTTQTAAATGCTLTWGNTWAQAPFCTFTGGLVAIVPPAAPGTATYAITFTSTAAAVVENYHCL